MSSKADLRDPLRNYIDATPEYKVGELMWKKNIDPMTMAAGPGLWAMIISKKHIMSGWAGAYDVFEYEVMLPDGTVKTCRQHHIKEEQNPNAVSKPKG